MTDTTAERVKHTIIEVLDMDEGPFELPDEDESITDDSLERIEIEMALEEEFEIEEISDDDMESVNTLGDWVDLVERKLAGKAAA
jgi:acyl carrier protein